MTNDSIYTLLDIRRDLPGWKLTKAVHAVIEELLDAYGSTGDVPTPLRAGIALLQEPDLREQYDSFLEWSEDGDEIDFGDAKAEVLEKAHQYHFTFEEVGDGKVRIVNLGIPDVPPPPTPEDLQSRIDERSASETTNEPSESRSRRSTPPHPGDAYGMRSGEVPPVNMDRRVFRIQFGTATLTHAVDQGDAIMTTWEQPQPDGPPNQFVYRDHLLKLTGADFLEVGGEYLSTLFKDVATGKTYAGANILTNSRRSRSVAPVIIGCGLWAEFPWYMKHWGQFGVRTYIDAKNRFAHENRVMGVPQITFGDRGWTDRTTDALKKFIYQATYWARAYGSDWQVPPDMNHELSQSSVAWYLENATTFSKKDRKKLELY